MNEDEWQTDSEDGDEEKDDENKWEEDDKIADEEENKSKLKLTKSEKKKAKTLKKVFSLKNFYILGFFRMSKNKIIWKKLNL